MGEEGKGKGKAYDERQGRERGKGTLKGREEEGKGKKRHVKRKNKEVSGHLRGRKRM